MTLFRFSYYIIILFLVLSPLSTFAKESTSETASITRVIDGDTIVVKIDKYYEKVRLIGIDTPETKDPRKTVQCFGKEASLYTTSLSKGKTAILKNDTQDANRDKYGRLLRYVYLTDKNGATTDFLNAKLIKDGYAYAYTHFPFMYKDQFKSYEKTARKNKKGLWSDTTCAGKRTSKK